MQQLNLMRMGIDKYTERGSDKNSHKLESDFNSADIRIMKTIARLKIFKDAEEIEEFLKHPGKFAIEDDALQYLVSTKNPYLKAFLQQDAKICKNKDSANKDSANNESDEKLCALLLECYKSTAKCLNRGLIQLLSEDLLDLQFMNLSEKVSEIVTQAKEKELKEDEQRGYAESGDEDDNHTYGPEAHSVGDENESTYNEDETHDYQDDYLYSAPYSIQEQTAAIEEYKQAREELYTNFPDVDESLETELLTAQESPTLRGNSLTS